jgi:hypothetical protein
MPELDCVNGLLNNAWNSVSAQAGQLNFRSARFPGAWSTTALVLDAASNVLICCDSVDKHGGEQFILRFIAADTGYAVSHLKNARPPHATIRDWPVELSPPATFFLTGPDSAEVGLGESIAETSSSHAGKIVPMLWCCFTSNLGSLMFFADGEIPLNVGIVTNPGSISAIKNEINAKATRRL